MEVISNRGFKCDVCNLVLLSKPIYDQHVSGQKHLKRLKSIESSEKAGTSLKCEVCNIDVMNQVGYFYDLKINVKFEVIKKLIL